MIPITCFNTQQIFLFGLGASGLATANALLKGGARVLADDDVAEAQAQAKAAGIEIFHWQDIDFEKIAALVLAPGIPLTHPLVTRARAHGKDVIGDIELFCRERHQQAPQAPFIAITGTNGKSTTTALIAHLLHQAGKDVQMGGNIGVPILALASLRAERFYVIECSSFQIELTPSLRPDVGVLLNVTPDHLDRHGSFEAYAALKSRMISSARHAFMSAEDSICQHIYAQSPSHTQVELLKTEKLPQNYPALRGHHNAQNATCAIAVARYYGLGSEQIEKGLASFPGLAHRMEEVRRMGRVLFINDSKATNADAAEKAIACFKDIYWILGGQAKEGGIESLIPYFSCIRHAFLIGEAQESFAHVLARAGVAYSICDRLEKAVETAYHAAALSEVPEAVVLFSPACASYDQFKNFEARGDAFRQQVLGLLPLEPSCGKISKTKGAQDA